MDVENGCNGKTCNPNMRVKSVYEEIAEEIGRIVTEKNQQYGNSFEDCEKYILLLYPNGIRPDQVGDVLYLARDFDKSKRIASGRKGNENPSMDKAGYAILDVVKQMKKENSKKTNFFEWTNTTSSPIGRVKFLNSVLSNEEVLEKYNNPQRDSLSQSFVPKEVLREFCDDKNKIENSPHPPMLYQLREKINNNPQIDAHTLAEFLNIDYKNAEQIFELSKQPDGIELTMGGNSNVVVKIITHKENEEDVIE
jgi:hypothetical protein